MEAVDKSLRRSTNSWKKNNRRWYDWLILS